MYKSSGGKKAIPPRLGREKLYPILWTVQKPGPTESQGKKSTPGLYQGPHQGVRVLWLSKGYTKAKNRPLIVLSPQDPTLIQTNLRFWDPSHGIQ